MGTRFLSVGAVLLGGLDPYVCLDVYVKKYGIQNLRVELGVKLSYRNKVPTKFNKQTLGLAEKTRKNGLKHNQCSSFSISGECHCGGVFETDCGSKNAECTACQNVYTLNKKFTCYVCAKSENCCVLQSTDEPMVETSAVKFETVTFHDEVKGEEDGFAIDYDDLVAADSAEGASLANFLERPVRIANFTWTEAQAIGTTVTVNPWHAFFNNTNVKFRTNNFGFIRCNLKIKIMINASPFYYGMMRVGYQPLPAFTPSTYVADTSFKYFIPLSQRPGIWLRPQSNSGGEMTLPFFYQKNWLELQVAQDFTDMGRLDFINYTQLDSANGASGTGVSIQVYAWAEDIHISGPSVGLAMQSKDEYGTGPVSRVASAVSKVAGMLKTVPVIGKFATATEIGARAIGGIAKLFGFTNVPVIADVQPFRPTGFPPMASTEIGYPVEKMSVDSKNELSIDPGILGLASDDELAIAYIAAKESYLTQFTWSSVSSVDTILFTSLVTPWLLDNLTSGVQTRSYLTPMAHVSYPFRYWRGDIEFRFKFVSTKYHKGRVKVSFDPQGYTSANLQNVAVSSGIVHTQIIDLTQDEDCVFRIPYQQALAWLKLDDGLTDKLWSTSASPSLVLDDSRRNGLITMRILTALTAPIATSSIPVLVFVRACENFELADPSEFPNNFTPFVLQSQDEVMGETTVQYVPERYRVNFGECVRSLRPLLRRSVLVDAYGYDPAASSSLTQTLVTVPLTRFPPYMGYDPTGYQSAKGTAVPASNFPFNFTRNSLYNWLSPAYVGQRGSTHWTFNAQCTQPINDFSVRRRTADWVGTSTVITTSTTATAWNRNTAIIGSSTAPGLAITNQGVNTGLSLSMTDYTQYKFRSTTPSRVTNPQSAQNTNDGTYNDWYEMNFSRLPVLENPASSSYSIKGVTVQRYFGIGTDFSLYWYLNAPVFYVLSTIPAL